MTDALAAVASPSDATNASIQSFIAVLGQAGPWVVVASLVLLAWLGYLVLRGWLRTRQLEADLELAREKVKLEAELARESAREAARNAPPPAQNSVPVEAFLHTLREQAQANEHLQQVIESLRTEINGVNVTLARQLDTTDALCEAVGRLTDRLDRYAYHGTGLTVPPLMPATGGVALAAASA